MALVISDEDYVAVQAQLQALTMVFPDPELLDGFIERANRAESIGPILHPSEWMAAATQLRLILRTAYAVRKAQREIQQAMETLR